MKRLAGLRGFISQLFPDTTVKAVSTSTTSVKDDTGMFDGLLPLADSHRRDRYRSISASISRKDANIFRDAAPRMTLSWPYRIHIPHIASLFSHVVSSFCEHLTSFCGACEVRFECENLSCQIPTYSTFQPPPQPFSCHDSSGFTGPLSSSEVPERGRRSMIYLWLRASVIPTTERIYFKDHLSPPPSDEV